MTWNARALCCRNKALQKRKVRTLINLLAQVGIAIVQEVHGSASELARACRALSSEWQWRATWGPSRSLGGVAIFWRRSRVPAPMVHPVFPGRLLRAAFLSDGAALRLWGSHIEQIPAAEATRAQAIMTRDRRWAEEDPQKRWVLAGGDWNFNVPGERSVAIATPQLGEFGRCSSGNLRCSMAGGANSLD